MNEFGSQQFLTPKRLAWVMDVGESTVADWLRSERGRPPLIAHFRQGRLIRIEPSEAARFVWQYTLVRAARQPQTQTVELLNCRTLNPEQFEVLAVRIERFTSGQLRALLELNGHLEAA